MIVSGNDKYKGDIEITSDNKSVNIQVSVVIPVYNEGENLVKAIESALNQNGVIVEVIVIDDCSTQNIEVYMEKYKADNNVVYIRNHINMGVAKSRNIGVRKARGNYIAYLDSDDWWDLDKLSKQINIIVNNNVDIVCTGRELALDNGVLTGTIVHVNKIIEHKALLKHNSIACSSVLMKRELALQYPMHDDQYHEDYINWLEITKKNYTVYGIDEPLLKYRLSLGGKSRNRLKSAYMTYKSYQIVGIGGVRAAMYTFSHISNGVIKYRLFKLK